MTRDAPYFQDWLWTIEVAAEIVPDATVPMILSRRRLPPLVDARRGIWLFLRDLGWSLPQIAKLTENCHTTVLHGINKGEPQPGSVAYRVREALQNGAKDRQAESAVVQEASTNPNVIGTIYRVSSRRRPEPHYVVEAARNGKVLPSRRLADGDSPDLRNLFAPMRRLESDPIFLRHHPVPEFMGGSVLVSATPADWQFAGGAA